MSDLEPPQKEDAEYDNPRKGNPVPPDKPSAGDGSAINEDWYKAKLDAWEESVKTGWARGDNDTDAEIASVAAIEAAYVDATKASLDRALTRANVLATSVAAVMTAYTGLLGLVYASKDGRALDGVAIIPGMFLGLSLFLLSIYAAMFRRDIAVGPLLPTGEGGELAEARLITFMQWCFGGVLARSWALHAGVVSLGVGIATLPFPFVNVDPNTRDVIVFAGLVVIATTAAWTALSTKANQGDPTLPTAEAAAVPVEPARKRIATKTGKKATDRKSPRPPEKKEST